MPAEIIKFWNTQESGWEALSGAQARAYNVMREPRGAIRRRPGIGTAPGVMATQVNPFGMEGVHYALNDKLYGVGAGLATRSVYEIGPTTARNLSAESTLSGFLGGVRKPVFAETEMLVLIGNGGKPQKVVKTTGACSHLGGAVPHASHIVAHASRLVVNDVQSEPGRVFVSDGASGTITYAGHEQWTQGVGNATSFTAEARPDPVVGLAENTNGVMVFGSTTTQVFIRDTSGRDVYVTAGTIEHGCSAPYSVVNVDESFAWLDERRRFVLSDGRGVQVLSDGIQRDLHELTTVADCWGFRFYQHAFDVTVWTFPTDKVAFAFQKGAGWSQWQGWSDANGIWGPLIVTGHTRKPGTSQNIVSTSSGYVGQMEMAAQTDLGARIPAIVESGFVYQATEAVKHCHRVRLVLRRGETTSSVGPQAHLCYRNAPGDEWTRIPVDLGASGSRDPVVTLTSLGAYRRRQWRFEFTGTDDLTLVQATEEYEVAEF